MRAIIMAALALTSADVAVLPQIRNSGGQYVPSLGAVLVNVDGTAVSSDRPLPTLATPVQESFQLVSANAPAGPVQAFGGNYIFAQTCDSYGSMSLEARGPDGSSWQTIVETTLSDTTGGQMVQLGSLSVVRVELANTTNCAAMISRVPA